MLNPPQSLTELVAYLSEHPKVFCTMPNGREEERSFLEYAGGGIHWYDPWGGPGSYTPIGGGHTGSETTITFTPAGFTIKKFGKTTEFDYLPD